MFTSKLFFWDSSCQQLRKFITCWSRWKQPRSQPGLTLAVIAVILIKYSDEEYLFLCNIYNAVNWLHYTTAHWAALHCSGLSLKKKCCYININITSHAFGTKNIIIINIQEYIKTSTKRIGLAVPPFISHSRLGCFNCNAENKPEQLFFYCYCGLYNVYLASCYSVQCAPLLAAWHTRLLSSTTLSRRKQSALWTNGRNYVLYCIYIAFPLSAF